MEVEGSTTGTPVCAPGKSACLFCGLTSNPISEVDGEADATSELMHRVPMEGLASGDVAQLRLLQIVKELGPTKKFPWTVFVSVESEHDSNEHLQLGSRIWNTLKAKFDDDTLRELARANSDTEQLLTMTEKFGYVEATILPVLRKEYLDASAKMQDLQQGPIVSGGKTCRREVPSYDTWRKKLQVVRTTLGRVQAVRKVLAKDSEFLDLLLKNDDTFQAAEQMVLFGKTEANYKHMGNGRSRGTLKHQLLKNRS